MSDIHNIIQIKFLYKYRNFENYFHFQSLIDQEIYFSDSSQLNDIFDGNINYSSDHLNESNIRPEFEKAKQRLQNHGISNVMESKWDNIDFKDPDNFKSLHKELNEIHKLRNKEDFGIYSLSTTHDNLLMWAHYANNFSGFVIIYNTSELINYLGLFGILNDISIVPWYVKYRSEYPHFKTLDSETPDSEYVAEPMLTKYNIWDYEKEIRFLMVGKTRTFIKLPSECFYGIIFGPKADYKNIINLIYKTSIRKNYLKYFKAFEHNSEFRLVIEAI